MSTDTIDFPPIDAAAPVSSTVAAVAALQPELAQLDLQAVALAQFNGSYAAVKAARETLAGVQHDLSTPTKLADAKSLRNRLINVPLADARKVSAGLKSKLTAVSKAVGTELTAIETAFEGVEQLITPQIEAAQTKLDEERRIAAEAEAARVAKHQANLAKLAAPIEHARGLPSSRIRAGIEMVTAIVIDRAAWEDFADRAEAQKAVTLERMGALLVAAEAAEAEERRRAEEKAEQERQTAALKAEADRLAAERAEFERQKAELQAERDRIDAEAQAKLDEAARVEREAAEAKAHEESRLAWERDAAGQIAGGNPVNTNTPAQSVQPVLKAEASTPDATDRDATASTSPVGGPMGAGQAAAAAPAPEVVQLRPDAEPAAAELPTMTLGQLGTRLGFNPSEGFLSSLGIEAHKDRASRLYPPSDFPRICLAISAHLIALAGQQQQAA